MAKTFYEVRYSVPGSSFIHTAWFSDREHAYSFYETHEAAFKPRPHHFRNPVRVEQYSQRSDWYEQKYFGR